MKSALYETGRGNVLVETAKTISVYHLLKKRIVMSVTHTLLVLSGYTQLARPRTFILFPDVFMGPTFWT